MRILFIITGSFVLVASLAASYVFIKRPLKVAQYFLFNGVESGNIPRIDKALRQGVNINTVDKRGRTPLVLAVFLSRVAVVEFLLGKGADPNLRDSIFGETALIAALKKENNEVVELLLRYGADINTANERGETPLETAVKENRTRFFKLFIGKGAAPQNDGLHLLQSAAGNRNFEIMSALFGNRERFKINEKEKNEALLEAFDRNDEEVVEFLLKMGADIRYKTSDGTTSLMMASRNGNNRLIKLCLSKGVDMNSVNLADSTALSEAASNHLETVKILLENGASMKKQTKIIERALENAAANGKEEIVKLLLAHATDLTEKDGSQEYSRKALQEAARNGHIPVVKLLLNRSDEDVLAIAVNGGHLETVGYLLDQGVKVSCNSIQMAINRVDAPAVRLLLENRVHADPCPLGEFLTLAVNQNKWAVEKNNKEIVSLLLSHGADVNYKDEDGKTALDYAYEGSNKEARALRPLLKKYGAKTTKPTIKVQLAEFAPLILAFLSLMYICVALYFQIVAYRHNTAINPFRWVNYLLVLGPIVALNVYLLYILVRPSPISESGYVGLTAALVFMWALPIMVVYGVPGYLFRNTQIMYYISTVLVPAQAIFWYFWTR